MAQFIYSMYRVSKVVPPKRTILKDISLSFFPGAKIGVLGLNGSGKSTLLRIMAGIDKEFEGEAKPLAGTKIGYLPQEPVLDMSKTVREVVEEAVADVTYALSRLDAVYAAYADENADFDALAREQGELEAIIQAKDGHNLDNTLERAADALRLPPWDARIDVLSGGERRRVAICRLLLEKPDMLPAGRTNQPLRRRICRLVRTFPARLPGHCGCHHARPLFPRQRCRLDFRAGPR